VSITTGVHVWQGLLEQLVNKARRASSAQLGCKVSPVVKVPPVRMASLELLETQAVPATAVHKDPTDRQDPRDLKELPDSLEPPDLQGFQVPPARRERPETKVVRVKWEILDQQAFVEQLDLKEIEDSLAELDLLERQEILVSKVRPAVQDLMDSRECQVLQDLQVLVVSRVSKDQMDVVVIRELEVTLDRSVIPEHLVDLDRPDNKVITTFQLLYRNWTNFIHSIIKLKGFSR